MSRWLIGWAIASFSYGIASVPASAHGGEDHSRPARVEESNPQTLDSETQPLEGATQAGKVQSPSLISPAPVSSDLEPVIAADSPRSFSPPVGELVFLAMLAAPVGLIFLRDRTQARSPQGKLP